MKYCNAIILLKIVTQLNCNQSKNKHGKINFSNEDLDTFWIELEKWKEIVMESAQFEYDCLYTNDSNKKHFLENREKDINYHLILNLINYWSNYKIKPSFLNSEQYSKFHDKLNPVRQEYISTILKNL